MDQIGEEKRIQAFIDLYKQQMERFRQIVGRRMEMQLWGVDIAGWRDLLRRSAPYKHPIVITGVILSVFVILHGVGSTRFINPNRWIRYLGSLP